MRLILVAALLFLSSATYAEDKKPPAGMTPDQYQSMVDDIADAVAKKLAAEPKSGKAEKTARPAAEKKESFDAIGSVRRLREQSSSFRATIPDYPVAVAGIAGTLDFEIRGEKHGLGWMLQWLLISALAGIAAEYAVRALLTRIRKRWQATHSIRRTRRYAACVGIDVLATAAMFLVVGFMSDLWLPGDGVAADVGAKLLTLFFIWRIAALILQIWFRPGDAECRIVAVGDDDAKLLARALSLLILAYQVGDSWMHIQTMAGLHVAALNVAVLVDNVYSSIADLSFIWFTRHATARWLTGLVRRDKGWFIGVKLALAKHWVVPALMFEVVMSSVQYYGSISGNTEVSLGLSTTLQAILLLLLLESAMDLPRRLADAAAAGASRKPGGGELVADMVLVLGRLEFCLFVVRIWSVEVLALFTPEQFSDIRFRNIATGLMIFAAYALWKIGSFMIDRVMADAPAFVRPGDEDAVQQPAGTTSRVQTVLPLLRATIAVVIFVLLLLLVLSQLGVNITPLIAGASVLGLAISFGSQTLVKDIVSGIFYLIDDAFRVGDYVDTGRVKGTVEGFTLRSIKMRHQNGQVHTIPFGQLGTITNYSRDWVTVKFNLRLARDVDLETVRKTTKKIGQEMMTDADLGPELLVPLKLQGVADIADNALVLRFKFTCKPTNPSIIQRQAVKRIYQTFMQKGINFASSAITVQTAAGQADPDPALAAAGAAAAAAAAIANSAKPT
jgi:moderate conductance mechanosensitive channel